VSVGDLQERKYAMYSGRRLHRSPHLAPENEPARQALVARVLNAQPGTDGHRGVFGWIAWSLAGLVAVGGLVGWRRGWFVPFSARHVKATRVFGAASPQAKSRGAQKPLFELVNHQK